MHFFCDSIIEYYQKHKRNLPWRETKDPYLIWISEIILQQTRVEQGINYYYKITERFPNVISLANAHLDELLKLWEGLGYYSRARNMHHAANEIKNKFKGKFPNNYEDIKSLKGIGEYTAAALSSFAYGISKPAIDGNVQRVISRYFGITDPVNSKNGIKKITEISHELISNYDAATYNQAMMEYGAMVCKPKNPDCINCNLKSGCFAYLKNQTNLLPLKDKKLKRKIRYLNYLFLKTPKGFIIKKRMDKDIWQNLYELPCIEFEKKIESKKVIHAFYQTDLLHNHKIENVKIHSEIKHVLTHADIYCTFFSAELKKNIPQNNLKKFIVTENLSEYAFPRLITRFFESEFNIDITK